jgi:acyl carrier protein
MANSIRENDMKNEWVIIWGGPREILREVLQFIRREQVRVCAGKAEWILDNDCHAIYLQTEGGLHKKDGVPWGYPFQKIVLRFPDIRIKVAYLAEPNAGLQTLFAGSETPDDSLISNLEAELGETAKEEAEVTESDEVEDKLLFDPNCDNALRIETAVRAKLNLDTGVLDAASLESIKKLKLGNCGLQDLSSIGDRLSGLKSLDLNINAIAELAPLTKLTKLKKLNLNTNNISRLNPLAELDELECLRLNSNQITDLKPLEKLDELEVLSLNTNFISDLWPLEHLDELEELHLSTNQITDLGPLSGLSELRELSLNKNQIANLQPLTNLSDLRVLRLSQNRITDLSPLYGLDKLEDIWLKNNPGLTEDGIDGLKRALPDCNIYHDYAVENEGAIEASTEPNPFQDCPAFSQLIEKYGLDANEIQQLDHLELPAGDVTSIKFLSALPALRSLDLDDNHISDLTPLIHCPQLESLSLNNNTVSDLTPLAGLEKLQRLEIQDNLVQDLSPLTGLQSLEILCIQNNRVQDKTVLDGLPNLKRVFDADNPCAGKPTEEEPGEVVEANSTPSADLEQEFLNVVAERLGYPIEKVNLDSQLSEDLGVELIDLEDLRLDINQHWNVEISDEDIQKVQTCRDLFQFVAEGMEESAVEENGEEVGQTDESEEPDTDTLADPEAEIDDDSEAEDEDNVEEKVLTREIAEQYIADEDSFDLYEFTRIDDAAAESLTKHEGDLWLNGLTELSGAAAESLTKHEGDLYLNGLTELSDAAAESLAKHEGTLYLDGLPELSDAAAESLAKHEGELWLNGLTELSDAAAESLAKYEGELWLQGLTELSGAAAESLAKHEGTLYLDGLPELSDGAAESLAKHEGTLCLNGLTELSDAAAESLGKHEGDLWLQGLTELSGAAAESLAKHEGTLYLDGLPYLSDATAESLAKHEGELSLDGSLDGMSELSDAAIEALSKKDGTICWQDPKEWAEEFKQNRDNSDGDEDESDGELEDEDTEEEEECDPELVQALIDSVRAVDLDGVRKAIDQGAPANPDAEQCPVESIESKWGGKSPCNPLEFASLHGHVELLNLLIEKGATIDRWDDTSDLAVKGKHLDALLILKENCEPAEWEAKLFGNAEEVIKAGDLERLQLLIEAGLQPGSKPGEDDLLPLAQAAKAGQKEVIDYLLDHGADIHANQDEALYSALEADRGDIAEQLIEKGAMLERRLEDLKKIQLSTDSPTVIRLLEERGLSREGSPTEWEEALKEYARSTCAESDDISDDNSAEGEGDGDGGSDPEPDDNIPPSKDSETCPPPLPESENGKQVPPYPPLPKTSKDPVAPPVAVTETAAVEVEEEKLEIENRQTATGSPKPPPMSTKARPGAPISGAGSRSEPTRIQLPENLAPVDASEIQLSQGKAQALVDGKKNVDDDS